MSSVVLSLGTLCALCALLAGCAPPELPARWPQDLPLYPGSILTGASAKSVLGTAQSDPQELLRLELRTVAEPEAVLQFYAEAAGAAGYVPDAGQAAGAPRDALSAAYTRGRSRFELSAWVDQRRATRYSHENTQRITKARLILALPLD